MADMIKHTLFHTNQIFHPKCGHLFNSTLCTESENISLNEVCYKKLFFNTLTTEIYSTFLMADMIKHTLFHTNQMFQPECGHLFNWTLCTESENISLNDVCYKKLFFIL